MSALSRVFLYGGAVLLIALVVLRVAAPEVVVNRPLGFVLALSWAFMLLFGVAEWKNLILSAAGKPIAAISMLLVAGATDFLLGLGFYAKTEWNPILVSYLLLIAVIMLFAWWKILWKGDRK